MSYRADRYLGETRLSHHAGCQCKVKTYSDGVIDFISYTTLVIRATPVGDDNYELECTGTYSPTTRKQIGYFLKEYFGELTYYDMKEIAGTEKKVTAKKCHAKYW